MDPMDVPVKEKIRWVDSGMVVTRSRCKRRGGRILTRVLVKICASPSSKTIWSSLGSRLLRHRSWKNRCQIIGSRTIKVKLIMRY